MTAPGPILHVQCFECSRWVHPADAIRIGESVIRCHQCQERMDTVIESFDEPPSHCPGCSRSFADLAAATPGQPVSMFAHLMDGMLAFLCKRCDREYVQKRKDLYRKTRYGWDRKLC